MTMENGKEIVYTSEPKTSVWDKLKVDFLQLLPLEEQIQIIFMRKHYEKTI